MIIAENCNGLNNPIKEIPFLRARKEYQQGSRLMSISDRTVNAANERLFEKHIPSALRSKKCGFNIAIVADLNIAGQLTHLFRLINEHTIHRARCIIFQGDYLSYDRDIVLSDNDEGQWEEAREIIAKADFFHVGRFPVRDRRLSLMERLLPNNCVIQYFGTQLRQNANKIYSWHQSRKITGIGAWDYTMIQNAPFFYHINMMFDSSSVQPVPAPRGTIRVVHPTTDRKVKKTELFLNAMKTLEAKYDVEGIVIEGKTNQECLALKRAAHMTFDQISVGIYGVSAIESLAMGHVVFGGISNFAASVYPDNPVVWITTHDVEQKMERFLKQPELLAKQGKLGREWVKRYHDPVTILRQFLYIYDLVRNGHHFMNAPDEQLLEKKDD